MGAIFGIWNRNGSAVDQAEPVLLQKALSGYGSASEGPVFRGSTAFGAFGSPLNKNAQENRIETSGANPDIVLVADVRIYNRDELISECNVSDRKNISDSALLMAAFDKWGERTPLHINGDFAFAVFNHSKNELRIFTDHLGIRPVFYYEDPDTVVFATDYQAILSLRRIPRRVNETMLYRIVSSDYIMLPEETHMEGLYKVPQAHFIIADMSSVIKIKYWTPGKNGIPIPEDEENCALEIRRLMRDAVEIRIAAVTEPIAAELSGGLDSSAITVFAARYLSPRKRQPVCFSWSPSFDLIPEQPRDERKLVESVCRQENLQCEYFSVEDKDRRASILQNSGNGVMKEELRVLSSKGIRAVFSGWGGDQGITHRTNLSELRVNGYYREFLSEIRGMANGSILRALKLLVMNSGPREYISRTFSRRRNKLDDVIRPGLRRKVKSRFRRDQLQFNRDILRHLESGNIQTRTHLCAELSSQYGIEYLFPFLDHRLVDFALSLPRHYFFKNGINRYVARKALIGVLPEEVRTYVPKDDIVRCSYFFAQKEISDQDRGMSTDGIRRAPFEPYIDFEKLDRLIRSKSLPDNRQLQWKVTRLLEQLKEIQADYD